MATKGIIMAPANNFSSKKKVLGNNNNSSTSTKSTSPLAEQIANTVIPAIDYGRANSTSSTKAAQPAAATIAQQEAYNKGMQIANQQKAANHTKPM